MFAVPCRHSLTNVNQQPQFNAGCMHSVRARVGGRVDTAHCLLGCTCADDTLRTCNRSCKSQELSPGQCLCPTKAHRSENRTCEAQGR